MNTKRTLLSTSITSILSLSLLLSANVNAAAENAGEFYLGAKTGWANFDFDPADASNVDDDAWAGSVYGGYQFNTWLSLEGGYNYLGKSHYDAEKTKLQNFELGAKADWNITDSWNLFGKLGGAYNNVQASNFAGDDNNISLMLGAGIEYQISHNWRLRGEYQWFDNAGDNVSDGAGYRAQPDVNYVSVGIAYYFGQAAVAEATPMAAPVEDQPMVEEPVQESAPVVAEAPKEELAVTLSTGAFTHDSTELTPAAKESMHPVADKLKAEPELTVEIVGHTDSSGSEAYNQKLSQQRAQSAADYLVSQDVDANRIVVKGEGETGPIADNATAEGREKNRRVEVFYERK
ncbi:OmpA family protein [Vibrio algicola]|uniref:OmpA family protein n=1 Tax=Vibrio algicola TaxID=2662262 RepID=A0A5Q0THQ6_9VIBR|nr:OmpA family protein [Vibrio algicola]